MTTRAIIKTTAGGDKKIYLQRKEYWFFWITVKTYHGCYGGGYREPKKFSSFAEVNEFIDYETRIIERDNLRKIIKTEIIYPPFND